MKTDHRNTQIETTSKTTQIRKGQSLNWTIPTKKIVIIKQRKKETQIKIETEVARMI